MSETEKYTPPVSIDSSKKKCQQFDLFATRHLSVSTQSHFASIKFNGVQVIYSIFVHTFQLLFVCIVNVDGFLLSFFKVSNRKLIVDC